ncbi:uncharacterized protein LOC121368956 [Gigantopelta aegis]|uniref:uncharacterized protein LOC121368956 n=1 Tax=Gigantopelta aegis TaxID=1735272 RepID=UPI001B888D5A|nr:uncharacterized protein LOC121368956 [Gigantopelta aegis]
MEKERTARVPCLLGILDLQKLVQSENLHFSEETNRYLLYQTLKKVGPDEAQKLISKLVERGEIVWPEDEDFEVEDIVDHAVVEVFQESDSNISGDEDSMC